MFVKDNGAVEVRQFDGNYFENRVQSPNAGRPDSHDGVVPRYYIPSGAFDQGLTASPNPLGNSETPLGMTYKEYDERNRYLDRITSKDSIGSSNYPSIIIKKYRRPRINSNQFDNINLIDNGSNDRLPNYIQSNSNNIDTRYNVMHDGTYVQPFNAKHKQSSGQSKPYFNDESLNEAIYGQCLNILSEKEKAFAGALGNPDLYELRPDVNQYLLPRLILGLSARNNDFADLTSYKRRKNNLSLNSESKSFANSPDENANDADV